MAVYPSPGLKRNVIEHYRLTVTEAAERLDVARPTMSNLLNGKADLSPETALVRAATSSPQARRRACGSAKQSRADGRRPEFEGVNK